MENFDYKPNSFKYKEEQKKSSEENAPAAQKVIKGPVTIKKPTGLRKVYNLLITEDLPKVKEYVLQDVLIPTIKKSIYDIITNASNILLYGEAGRSKNQGTFGSRVSYKDYSSYSKSPSLSSVVSSSSTKNTVDRTGFDFDQYVFNFRGDAEMVLTQLEDMLSRYKCVRVSNFYEAIGEKSNNYNLYNYGWTNLSSAKVARVQNGYILQLPNPYPLD